MSETTNLYTKKQDGTVEILVPVENIGGYYDEHVSWVGGGKGDYVFRIIVDNALLKKQVKYLRSFLSKEHPHEIETWLIRIEPTAILESTYYKEGDVSVADDNPMLAWHTEDILVTPTQIWWSITMKHSSEMVEVDISGVLNF